MTRVVKTNIGIAANIPNATNEVAVYKYDAEGQKIYEKLKDKETFFKNTIK